jgi:hypothetical protein
MHSDSRVAGPSDGTGRALEADGSVIWGSRIDGGKRRTEQTGGDSEAGMCDGGSACGSPGSLWWQRREVRNDGWRLAALADGL